MSRVGIFSIKRMLVMLELIMLLIVILVVLLSVVFREIISFGVEVLNVIIVRLMMRFGILSC